MKKLHKIAKLVGKIYPDLSQLVKYHGFITKRVRGEHSAANKLYIHEGKKIVVKTGYIVGRRPKYAIPTVMVRKEFEIHNGCTPIVVQPLASLKNRELARDRLHDKYKSCESTRLSNIGWYKKKPVAIDW